LGRLGHGTGAADGATARFFADFDIEIVRSIVELRNAGTRPPYSQTSTGK
jgi:hypothetical protein